MNKIYRRLWSTARQCWVVASELTAARGKRNRTVIATSALLMAVPGSALAGAAEITESELHWWQQQVWVTFPVAITAAETREAASVVARAIGTLGVNKGTVNSNTSASNWAVVSGAESMALGSEAYATALNSLAAGNRARADGANSVVVGNRSIANGTHSTVLGYATVSDGRGYSTIVGTYAEGRGIGTTALGHNAKAFSDNSIAVGSGARTIDSSGGNSRIAIGGDAFAGSAGWTGAVALGGTARADYDGVALGHGAKARANGSIALGRDSIASESNTVSVGQQNAERRIVNVQNGNLSSTSTDAVNGRQLHATNLAVTSAANTANAAKRAADQALFNNKLITQTAVNSGIRVGGDNTGSTVTLSNKDGATRYLNGVRNGRLETDSTDAVTGQQLHATNQNVASARNVANAAKTTADAAKTTADGAAARLNESRLALGRDAAAEGLDAAGSTAVGVRAKAYNSLAVAMGADARAGVDGSGNKTTASGAVALGAGTRSGNASVAAGLNAMATGNEAAAVGGGAEAKFVHSTAMGYKATAGANQATALGREAVASSQFASAVGNLSKATAERAMALGSQSVASHAGSVALGSGSQTTAANQISVGTSGQKRKIVNVENATLIATSTDAVTGAQLFATNANVTTAQNTANAAQQLAAAVKVTADDALRGVGHLRGLVNEVAGDGNVRLGGENTGAVLDVRNKNDGTRRVAGVSDGALGSASTEAVTGRQLHATNQLVDTQGQALLAHGQTLTSHGQQLGLHDRRIGDNRADLDKLRADFEHFDPDLDGVVRFAVDGSVDLGGGKVRGVAAGDISSAASTEAVNGGQLFATNQSVERIEASAQFVSVGSGGPLEAATAGLVAIAIGDSAVASLDNEGGVAIGSFSAALGKNSVALGRASRVSVDAEDGFALGVRSRVEEANGLAVGAASVVMKGADHSVAIGSDSIAEFARTVSFGSDSLKRRLVNVGLGLQESDAVVMSQLIESVALLGGGAGMDSAGGVVAPRYDVQGAIRSNVGDALMALDSVVDRHAGQLSGIEDRLSSVFKDRPTVRSDGLTSVALSGVSGMVLSNVANGTVAAGSRDAVNGGQLFEARQIINQNREDLDELRERGHAWALFDNRSSFETGAIDFNGARLIGLSDGALGEASTDAVTGRQLYATNQLAASQGRMLNAHGQQLGSHDRRIGESRADLDRLRAAFEDFDPDLEGVVRFAVDGSVDMGGGKVREIAAGDVSSASSTEAVNGGQLFATNGRVSDLEAFGRFFKIGTDDESLESRAGWFGVAIGESSEATPVGGTEGGTAVGSFSKAFGTNSVALGRAAHVAEDATDGFSLGARSHVRSQGGVALGASARVMPGADMAVAVGYNSFADEAYTVSFGARDVTRRLLNISAGRGDADAVNMGQARSLASMLGSGADFDSEGRVVAPSYLIQGSLHSNPGDALSALDTTVTTTTNRVSNVETQLSSIFSSTPTAQANGTAQLTLAGAQGMVISNVANGLVAAGSRDAVNGGQLHAVQQQLNGRMDGLEQRVDGQPQARASLAAARTTTTDEATTEDTPQANAPQVASTADAPKPQPAAAPAAKADAPEDVKPQVDTADLERMLARANEYTDGISREVDARLDKMDKRFNRMAAMNSAQAAMAMNTAGLSTYNRLGAGVGYSEGESAMAVGYQRVLNEKGSATFSLNGAFTNSGERTVGVGVGIGW